MNPDFGTLDEEMAVAVASATTSSTNETKVTGQGIYLELLNEAGNQTTQILVTPAGVGENGEKVSMAIITRSVSEWSPRKQWRTSFARVSDEKLSLAPADIAIELSKQIERVIERQVMYGSQTLRKSPIVFELTNTDLSEIGDWKAPAAALRRIQKARVSLGFPEKLV